MKYIGHIFFLFYSALSTYCLQDKTYILAAVFGWFAILNLAYVIIESIKDEIKKLTEKETV